MTEKKEKFPSTFTIDNFSSTATLTNNEYKVPIGSVDIINEKVYDPYEHRNIEHANSFSGALIHLLKSSLGTGILAIPRAFKNAGLVVGLIGTVLIGLLCTHTIHILVAASQEMCRRSKTPSLGFAETAEAVFKHGPQKLRGWSKFAKFFVEIALLLTYYVGNAVYIVFIATSINQLLYYYYPDLQTDYTDKVVMVIIMVPLVIFCQVRELKHLVPFSFIANATMVIAFAITLYYMFNDTEDIDISKRDFAADITGLPLFFSTVIFAMEGIGTIMPVENSMTKPQFIGCPGVLNFAMAVVIIMYSSIGFFGYLKYGPETEDTITKNLPVEEIPAQIAKACISIAVFFTFMLQFYVPLDITWRRINHMIPQNRHNVAQILLRTGLVLCITAIAIAAGEHLGPLIDLVGAVFFSTLGLFIPAVIGIVLNLEMGFGFLYWKLIKDILIIILAFFGMITGSYYAILSMIN